MKVLVTGARGQVGSATVEQFSTDGKNDVVALQHSDLDISSRNDVLVAATQIQPDVIVNAAAMTNVDACESEIDQAFAINALGVRNLADAAKVCGSHLIHISTDFVFDGKSQHPYTEFDIANPLSVYATSKLGGDTEALAYELGSVVRVAWVFGNPNGDFFSWVANGVKEGNINSLIDDQTSTPTYSRDVAEVIEHIAKHRMTGLINVANAGETTRLEMGRELCKKLGIEKDIDGIPADSLGRPAPRPSYSSLSTSVLQKTTGIEMRSWQSALDDYISRMNMDV